MALDYETPFAGFLTSLADAARETALHYFRRKDLVIDDKDDNTPVTAADREIEEKLRALIRKKYPAHGIIGEEFGVENENAEFVWAIDPIDGTKQFATGRPTFGTIIGLAHSGKPVMGVIDQAYTKERWLGVADKYCLFNGATVKVAAPRPLSAARLYTTTPDMFDGPHEKNFETLRKSVKWTQYSGDCYAYGLIALGWVDLVVERQLKVCDVIGLVPIIKGAGGFTSGWDGKDITLKSGDTMVAASSKALAQAALAIMRRTADKKSYAALK